MSFYIQTSYTSSCFQSTLEFLFSILVVSPWSNIRLEKLAEASGPDSPLEVSTTVRPILEHWRHSNQWRQRKSKKGGSWHFEFLLIFQRIQNNRCVASTSQVCVYGDNGMWQLWQYKVHLISKLDPLNVVSLIGAWHFSASSTRL